MRVFLSYTRAKNQFGAVSEFDAHFAQELELHVSGSTVFRDTLHIETGQPFPEVLRHELIAADVLLMLVSPAWLRNVWCRVEYDTFINVGNDARKRRRLLPVLWVPTPLALESNDTVVRTLAALQFDDWTELRHLPWTDAQCRQRIAALAARAPALLARPRLPEQAEMMLERVAEEGAISKKSRHPQDHRAVVGCGPGAG
jgi:hypothetical protein